VVGWFDRTQVLEITGDSSVYNGPSWSERARMMPDPAHPRARADRQRWRYGICPSCELLQDGGRPAVVWGAGSSRLLSMRMLVMSTQTTIAGNPR
jgi:hypothetical protein